MAVAWLWKSLIYGLDLVHGIVGTNRGFERTAMRFPKLWKDERSPVGGLQGSLKILAACRFQLLWERRSSSQLMKLRGEDRLSGLRIPS